jgi:hypothetical protein
MKKQAKPIAAILREIHASLEEPREVLYSLIIYPNSPDNCKATYKRGLMYLMDARKALDKVANRLESKSSN